ncbi:MULTISPECIES: hypothetical protein [unclassified Microcoleus]|uniref:hypothetical protein n=1 Tax=unclassified Microcoleus TaxID=2642155 RepID=UPI0025FC6EF1|nr:MULTISPECIES: hypothetical protein [unclassified Microcoleus]
MMLGVAIANSLLIAIETRYTLSINPPPDAAMTIQELAIQEIDRTPDKQSS